MINKYEIKGDFTVLFLDRKNGEVIKALISTSDLDYLKQLNFKWFVKWSAKTKSFYVNAKPWLKDKQKYEHFILHRLLMRGENIDGFQIDHINHDTLDNRRENLRVVTKSQNMQNRKGAQINSKSGIRGVCFHNQRNKWRVFVNGVHGGLFENIEDAKNKAIELRKKFTPFSKEAI